MTRERDHVPAPRKKPDERAPRSQPSPPVTGAEALAYMQQQAGNRAAQALVGRALAAQRQAGPPPAATSHGVIVDDGVTDLRPEQMRRGDFVRQARAAAQEGAQAGAGPLAARADAEVQTTADRYAGQSASQLEATVRAEIPGAAGATAAPPIVNLIRDAATNEARGQLSASVDEGAAKTVSSVTDTVSQVADAASRVADAAAQAASNITNVFFKARADRLPVSGPSAEGQVRASLGRGGDVPSALRAEVEGITGEDLSGVRLHTAAPARAVADTLGARALTVGADIVVGTGEEGPGTLPGDALLAHELAHAAQQARTSTAAATKSEGDDADAEETAADDVAVAAVGGAWAGFRGRVAELAPTALARLKTGLKLQRCGRAKVDPTKEALNKQVLGGMAQANDPAQHGSPDRGIYYPFNYQRQYPDDWKRLGSPSDGYADPKYWHRVEFMHWVRNPGVSASAAMDAWFRGPTIADCASVATASEVNALRAAIGDEKFDRLFGGERTKPIENPDGKRYNLEIGQGATSSVVSDLMRATPSRTDPGRPGARNVRPGEWHYFANHPAYPKKHPSGYWQGENALYQGEVGGKQTWTGFGATETEEDMNKVLVHEYNLPPSPEDQTKRQGWYQKYGAAIDGWPDNLKRFHGDYPDQITIEEMLNAGGGFDVKFGQELDPDKVKALRDRPDLNR